MRPAPLPQPAPNKPKPETKEPKRVKLTILVLPETARKIEQEAGEEPLGCAVDRLLAKAPPELSGAAARSVLWRLPAPKIESEAEILARLNNPQFKK